MKKDILQAFIALSLLAPQLFKGMPAPPYPILLKQPNGIEFEARMYGDEWENWATTMDGYLIIDVMDAEYNLWWHYALTDANGYIVPTEYQVGISGPPVQRERVFFKSTLQHKMPKCPMLPKTRSLQKSCAVPPDTVFKPLVILVDFSGILPGQMPGRKYTRSQFAGLIFSKNLNPNTVSPPLPTTYQISMRDYYSEVSRGRVNIIGDINSIVDWTIPKYQYSYYVDGNQGMGFGSNGITRSMEALTIEILQTLDQTVDYSQFDANGDGYVDFVILIVEGWATGPAQNQFWSFMYGLLNTPLIDPHANTNAFGNLILDGVAIYKCFTTQEQIYNARPPHCQIGDIQPIAVFCHEMGHVIGLPDLYDTGTFPTSAGIGDWGIMATGGYNQLTSPAYFCAWCRSQMGWITPKLLSGLNNASIIIDPAELNTTTAAYKIPIDPYDESEYFLIENRQAIGSDQYLHGTGLLIWHIDKTFTDIWPGLNNVNQIESAFGVNLMQADNQGHLYSDIWTTWTNPGDAGDPYPGSSGNMNFTDSTSPNAMCYQYDRNADATVEASSNSNVSISNITAKGLQIQATLTCPSFTGRTVGYDEGDWQYWFMQNGSNLAGIVINLQNTYNLISIKTVFRPTFQTHQLTGYTIRIWDGFDSNTGLTGQCIHQQSGSVNWSASGPQRQYGWVTLPISSTASVRCEAGKNYYIEVEYAGNGLLIPFDGGIYFNSLPSGNSYWRPIISSACTPLNNGDWNIRAVFSPLPTSLPISDSNIPIQFALKQNHPNPFNNKTIIEYSIPYKSHVTLQVINLLGKEIVTLVQEEKETGYYRIDWDGKNRHNTPMSSGVYFVKLEAGDFFTVRKMIYIR
ncbi:M6 family metalloprotease domain-containing protein [bacterium]|nr:M6 family metalloprotease domain-containing protein [bacterium]